MQCRLFYCIMENEQRGMSTFILAVCGNVDYIYTFPPSPPSRAAWIEIEKVRYLLAIRSRRLHGRRGLKLFPFVFSTFFTLSPPSRAAWIEICPEGLQSGCCTGRRLHGRRGLKFSGFERYSGCQASPPSRAAWIEIFCKSYQSSYMSVAAFTGGVD